MPVLIFLLGLLAFNAVANEEPEEAEPLVPELRDLGILGTITGDIELGFLFIDGNTDARGSREYNLALGQRRAESVKQSLEVLGVKPAQIEAVSFGKEKPRAEGDSEAANAENRRADFVYPQ